MSLYIRSMLSTYFVAADPRVVATVNFAPYGHGLYFCNATEVQKFSISAAFVKQGRTRSFGTSQHPRWLTQDFTLRMSLFYGNIPLRLSWGSIYVFLCLGQLKSKMHVFLQKC